MVLRQIVHFGKFYHPRVGGIETVTESMASSAAVSGFTVSVVCFGEQPKPRVELIKGVKIIRAPLFGSIKSQPLSISYLKHCIKEGSQADLIHLHAPNVLAGVCALLLNRRVKLVVHWHSDIVGKGLTYYLYLPIQKLLLARSDLIITTSAEYARASPSLTPYEFKQFVLPIGIRDPLLKPMVQALPNRLVELISGRKIILSVGRLVTYKGFEVLIEAASLISGEAVVVIVGDGPLREKLDSMISAKGLTGRVLLVGKVDAQCLQLLYSIAELFCLSSLNRAEAFGVVLVEALANGLPIVTTKITGSGVSWVNQHNVTGLNVLPGDSKQLADACNKILESAHLRASFSLAARERFLSEFQSDTLNKKLIERYSEFFE